MWFVIGVSVGVIIGFVMAALLAVAGEDSRRREADELRKHTEGDSTTESVGMRVEHE